MLAESVLERASSTASPAALSFIHSDQKATIEHWSYATLRQRAELHTGWLCANVEAGSYVAIRMDPVGECVAALLAAEKCGLPAVLIPATLPNHETSDLLNAVRPAAVLTTESSPGFRPSTTAAVDDSVRWITLKDQSDSDEPANGFVCQLTSGSLGPSRLAVRTADAIGVEIKSVVEALRLSRSDSVLCASSIAHSYGLVGGLLAPLLEGSHVLIAGNADDAAILVDAVRPTIVFGLAPTYASFLHEGLNESALSQSRYLLSAGAPLPTNLFPEFLSRFDRAIRQDYGTTETGTVSIDFGHEAVPNSVGRPLAHVELTIRRPVVGQIPNGSEGEICVRSTSIASHILQGRKPLPTTDEEGWYHTGDSGYLSDDGLLHVGERLREEIVLNGVAVHPGSVEDRIRGIPGVTEVVALPAQTEDGLLIRVVVVAAEEDPSEIQRAIRGRLPETQKFLTIELVDELPKSPAGKILQKYLM